MVHVVYGIDSGYLGPLLVSAYSLMKTARNPTKITVLTTDPSVAADTPEIHALQDCFPGHEIAVRHFDDPSLRQYDEQANTSLTKRFPAAVMIPLFIPWIVADDRCLFLDADTIVIKDLAELWNTELRGGGNWCCSGHRDHETGRDFPHVHVPKCF